MTLDNLIKVIFTDGKLSRMDGAMSEIERIFKGKAVNLTPKQRQQYGSKVDKMEVWVDKRLSIWSKTYQNR